MRQLFVETGEPYPPDEDDYENEDDEKDRDDDDDNKDADEAGAVDSMP